MASNLRAEKRDDFTLALNRELAGAPAKGDLELLRANPDRWRLELVDMQSEIQAELGVRKSESIRKRGNINDYFDWRNQQVAVLNRIAVRLRQAKLLQAEGRADDVERRAVEPPTSARKDAKNRIGAWAATIAAGLCTEDGIADREVVERAVNMAEMIDRLLSGADGDA